MISVIIPVYNTASYVEDAVLSVLNQTWKNLEVLLIDDGSSDDSGAVCDTLSAMDERIRVAHIPHGGAGAARNCGIALAKGDYFAFVDSDDRISPAMYQVLMRVMLTMPDTDIVECGLTAYFPNRRVEYSTYSGVVTLMEPIDAVCAMTRWELFRSSTTNKVYRRSVVQDIRFPEISKFEDEFTTWKFFTKARQVASVDISLYDYNRRRKDSIMSVITETILTKKDAFAEMMDYAAEIGNDKLFLAAANEYCRCALESLMVLHDKKMHTEPFFNAIRDVRQRYKMICGEETPLLQIYHDCIDKLTVEHYEEAVGIFKEKRSQIQHN